jgi:hypothetical protein
MELNDKLDKDDKNISNKIEDKQITISFLRKSSNAKSRKQSCNSKNSDYENKNIKKNKETYPTTDLNEITISNYKINLNDRLGSGAFGEIFKGYNLLTSESVAIKIESVNNPVPQLANEYKLLKLLNSYDSKSYSSSLSPILGFPKAYHYCNIGNYNFLVLEELGKNLEQLLKEKSLNQENITNLNFNQNNENNGFTLKTILQIADQIVSSLV